jgi:ribosomal-protein-alanine N-acetyltransferase
MIQLSMPVTIKTERLLLRRLRYEDAEEIFYAYASKPEATRFLSWPTHRSVDDTRHFVNYAIEGWNAGTDYTYSIRLVSGTFIGCIGAINENGKIQIGYAASPSQWGRGYMTETCGRVLSLLNNMDQVYRIGTFVDAENTASIRVLEKCGMVAEARLPAWFRFVNQGNEPRDCILFRLKPQ